MVFYDSEQLVYECNGGMAFKNHDGYVQQDYFTQSFGELGSAFRDYQRGYKEHITTSPPFSKKSPLIRQVKSEDIYVRWYKILEEFGNRELTFSSDALPAISGFVSTFASLKGDTYLGGIWMQDFPSGLCLE